MREIKFRAWKHVNTPEMFNDVQVIDFKSGIAHLGYSLSSFTERTDKERLSNLILMQYTGFKDKNGVEIYEGDIVKFYDIWDELTGGREKGQQRICRVEYVGSGFLVVQGDEDGYEQDLFMAKINDDDLEVIGNIYENPELLGDSQ